MLLDAKSLENQGLAIRGGKQENRKMFSHMEHGFPTGERRSNGDSKFYLMSASSLARGMLVNSFRLADLFTNYVFPDDFRDASAAKL